MLTKDLKHGMVIPSMYNNLGLFINHYPNGVRTYLFIYSFIYKISIFESLFFKNFICSLEQKLFTGRI